MQQFFYSHCIATIVSQHFPENNSVDQFLRQQLFCCYFFRSHIIVMHWNHFSNSTALLFAACIRPFQRSHFTVDVLLHQLRCSLLLHMFTTIFTSAILLQFFQSNHVPTMILPPYHRNNFYTVVFTAAILLQKFCWRVLFPHLLFCSHIHRRYLYCCCHLFLATPCSKPVFMKPFSANTLSGFGNLTFLTLFVKNPNHF